MAEASNSKPGGMIQALILSMDHKILDGGWVIRESLTSLTQEFASHGIELGNPCGNIPPQFAYILDAEASKKIPQNRWFDRNTLLGASAAKTPQIAGVFEFYSASLLGGWHPPTRHFDVFHFGAPGLMASRLAHLVAKGQKRLTVGWVKSTLKAGLTIPKPGLISVVTDGFGLPVAAIETESVQYIKFKDISEEIALREGEGDLTLTDWKAGHWEYFTTYDALEIGEPFSEDEELFVESFKKVHTFSSQSKWDQPTVYMLVGPTGAGKSTVGRALGQNQKLHIFSIDAWMRELFWKDSGTKDLEWALERCKRCEAVIEKLLEQEIRLGRGAILDLGFSTKTERSDWFHKVLGLGGVPKLIEVDADVETRWQRVQARNAAIAHDPQSITVDRKTFDWMEGYFEPLTTEERHSIQQVGTKKGPLKI